MTVIVACCFLLLRIHNIQSYYQLVIPGKTQAESSSVYGYTFFPNKTVDGNTGQQIAYCMHTQNKNSITEAWLRVNLTQPYRIKKVKFWYRNDRGSAYYNTIRLRGYSIRVSNDSDVPPLAICHSDPGNVNLPTVIENECVATAQYVWFYQTSKMNNEKSPMLEICEVQIFGCDTNWIHNNCSHTCDHCKNTATCGIEQRDCDDQGCALSGFQPPLCTVQCTSGTFGYNCSQSCGHCLGNSACNPIDGRCTEGCDPGWQPTSKCDTSCSRGTYGKDCMYKCSGNCRNPESCNPVDGRCTQCMPGWENELCNKTCSDGRYGEDCSKSCSEHCLTGVTCNRIDGTCTACMPGWQDPLCNSQCTPGTYGHNCAESCGHCLGTSACDLVDGRCTHGCDPGWQPTSKCDTSCSNGTFGKQCMYNCSGNCLDPEQCNKVDGGCKQCMPGWENKYCNRTCENGRYGSGCETPCGHCFGSDVCHHINGSCPGNCSDGYTGKKCSDACRNGWYGPGCETPCGHCLGSDVCHHINGSCPGNCSDGFRGDILCDSCKNGWYGSGCETRCGHCFGSDACHHINGSCPGNCSDGYTGETCSNIVEQISSSHVKSQSSDLIAIPVAIIISIIVIVAIIIFLLRWKRRNMFRQKLEEENVYYLPDITKEDGNEYEELNNIEETSLCKNQQFKPKSLQHSSSENRMKPIMIMDLMSTIHKLEKHSNIGFKREFESISSDVSEYSCKAGKLRINVPKNRYATTLPYDHSRVILSSTQNDYINANIIKNARGEPAYIATQGPTSSTMCEFWHMVWQEKICVVAMTTYHGNGYEDINQYLPHSIARSVENGNFWIQLMSDKTYSCFKIRHIQITCKQTEEIRRIKHLEFTAWPKHGTPPPLELLVYYHYLSRSMEECPENKLLVHCSSGTGQTAVIIALDALYKHGLKTGMINIAEFVGNMREDRMNMIQDVEQYICLHYALYECFRATFFVLNKDTFLVERKLPKIKDEFNILSSIRPSGICFENRQTRSKELEYENITSPGNKKVTVWSSINSYGLDVLDAVMQSSFTTKDCIVTGRYPNHGEAVDLIHLLIEQKCSILISVYPPNEVPYSKEWYSQFVKLQDFQVELIPGTKISEHIMLSTLRTKTSPEQDWQQMAFYEIISWKFAEKLPTDVNAILDVIKFALVDKHVGEKSKLVILSKDGATGCGVFCAVYNAIQQLQQDEEVDMFTIVRQLQSRRPEMLSDLSEYLFCYKAVTHYVKGSTQST